MAHVAYVWAFFSLVETPWNGGWKRALEKTLSHAQTRPKTKAPALERWPGPVLLSHSESPSSLTLPFIKSNSKIPDGFFLGSDKFAATSEPVLFRRVPVTSAGVTDKRRELNKEHFCEVTH